MRILVLGAGVLGCNVAIDLYKAGADVTLLARGEWYQTIKKNGLRIKDKFSFGTKTYPIRVIHQLEAEDAYDVIFVSLRYTQLDSIIDVLKENASKVIIFNGNNPTATEFASQFPNKHILFSFAEVGGNRDGEKVNSFSLHKMTIGGLTESTKDQKLINEIFGNTKIRTVYEPNMGDYLICHAAFVVPVCFACYHTDGNLKKIKNDKAYIHRIIDANIECYRAIEKLGHKILPESDRTYNTPNWKRKVFVFYKFMASCSLGKLVASDHALSAIEEMAALSDEMEILLEKAGTGSKAFDELKMDLVRYRNRSIQMIAENKDNEELQ